MPDTMIERLARAIADSIVSGPFEVEASVNVDGGFNDFGGFYVDGTLDLYKAARAVLTAMREPTEPMIVAGGKAMHWDGWRHDVDDENFTPEEYEADPQLRWSFERTARPTFEAMIAAALAEEG